MPSCAPTCRNPARAARRREQTPEDLAREAEQEAGSSGTLGRSKIPSAPSAASATVAPWSGHPPPPSSVSSSWRTVRTIGFAYCARDAPAKVCLQGDRSAAHGVGQPERRSMFRFVFVTESSRASRCPTSETAPFESTRPADQTGATESAMRPSAGMKDIAVLNSFGTSAPLWPNTHGEARNLCEIYFRRSLAIVLPGRRRRLLNSSASPSR
jgi:hypothetical protein